MIVHNNMSPLNIFGELYCRVIFFVLVNTVICLCLIMLFDGNNKHILS